MDLKIFNRGSHFCLEKITLITVVGLLGGCSSDFTRFTDGVYTGSASSRHAVVKKPVKRYQQPSVVQGGYRVIESGELPPVIVPSSERMVQSASVDDPYVPEALPASGQTFQEEMSGKERLGRREYIVKRGDTLYDLSRKNNVSIDRLKRENGLSGDMIRIGQTLILPGEEEIGITNAMLPRPVSAPVMTPSPDSSWQDGGAEMLTVNPDVLKEVSDSSGEEKTVASSANAVTATTAGRKEEVESVIAREEKVTEDTSLQMRWPVQGRILSHFGQREGTSANDGVDIMVPEGTPVKAADSGVVIYAGDGLKEFGNTILIRHDNNIVTVYGHNSIILVQRGQDVRRGDEIAKSGMSGNASAPRLHFEVRKNSTPVDPVKYLEN